MISRSLIVRSIRSRVPFYTKPVPIKKKLVAVGFRQFTLENQQGARVGLDVGTRCVIGPISLEQCVECFNIAPTAFLTFHRRCNNRKINSLRLLRALINVEHSATSRSFFHLLVVHHLRGSQTACRM